MSKDIISKKKYGCFKDCLIGGVTLTGLFFILCIAVAILVPNSANSTYKKALNSFEKKEYKKALKLTNETLKKDSLKPYHHILKGIILFELNDTIGSKKALELAKVFSDTDSLKQIVYKKIIDWRIRKNDTINIEESLSFFFRSLKDVSFEEYIDSYYYVADKMVILGKPEHATTILTSVVDTIQKLEIDLISSRKVYYRVSEKLLTMEDTIKSIKVLKKAIHKIDTNNFQSSANSYYYVANKMSVLARPGQARIILTSFIDSIQKKKIKEIDFSVFHYEVSEKLLDIGDTIQSNSILKKLIQVYPNATLAYKHLGNNYFNLKSNSSAVKYFKKYAIIDTSDVAVYRKIGESYSNLRKKKSAIKYFRIASIKGDKKACNSLRELTAKTRYYTRSRCCDGSTSSSTGRGACSHHGGVCRIEHIPYKEYTMNCL